MITLFQADCTYLRTGTVFLKETEKMSLSLNRILDSVQSFEDSSNFLADNVLSIFKKIYDTGTSSTIFHLEKNEKISVLKSFGSAKCATVFCVVDFIALAFVTVYSLRRCYVTTAKR